MNYDKVTTMISLNSNTKKWASKNFSYKKAFNNLPFVGKGLKLFSVVGIALAFTLFFAIVFLSSCADRVAGTGTETSTGDLAMVKGRVLDASAIVKEGVTVTLIPVDFIPGPNATLPASNQSTSDSLGNFQFSLRESGQYNLEGHNLDGTLKFLLRNKRISLGDTLKLGDAQLDFTTLARIPIPKNRNLKGDYMCLVGTPYWTPISDSSFVGMLSSLSDTLIFPSLPLGELPQLAMSSGGNSHQVKPLYQSLSLKSGINNVASDSQWIGTSLHLSLQPGEDIRQVVSSMLPGDTVSLRKGIHSVSGLHLSGFGMLNRERVLRAWPGEKVVLRGTSNSNNLINLSGTSYWVIDGLDIDSTPPNSDAIKLKVEEPCNNITIQKCVFHGIGSIGVNSEGNHHDIVVQHNEFHSFLPSGLGAIRIGRLDGPYTAHNWRVSDNWIHHIGNKNDSTGFGIQVQTGSYRIEVADNILHDIGNMAIAVFGPATAGNAVSDELKSILQRNAIWNCGIGMRLHGSAKVINNIVQNCSWSIRSYGRGQSVRGVKIYHNTLIGSGSLELRNWEAASQISESSNAFAFNAVYLPDGIFLGDSSESTNNIIHNNIGQLKILDIPGFLPGNYKTDFNNAEINDFSPKAGGMLENRCNSAALVSDDFWKNSRQKPADCGALEEPNDTAIKIVKAGFKP